jgi:hypothetical protein
MPKRAVSTAAQGACALVSFSKDWTTVSLVTQEFQNNVMRDDRSGTRMIPT